MQNEVMKLCLQLLRSFSICVLVVTGVSSFPVIGLLCFHIVLVCRGRTTNEQVVLCSIQFDFTSYFCLFCNFIYLAAQR